MNMPKFTADASLYRTRWHYQSVATRVGSCGDNEVIAQRTWGQAEQTRRTLGFGVARCYSVCPKNPQQTQFCREECYWWPY
jgi:hypothetical protein